MNISFIVPLHNEETTIVLCMEAIVAQMRSGDEVIVVDNGSSDSSISKINSFSNITIIEKPKCTIAAVRNAGAAIAKGDILAFIDADCVLSNYWRVEVAKSLKDDGVGATGSKVDIPDDAVWIERVWYSQRDDKCSRVSYINSGNFVVRKSIFDKVGGFSEELITGEDSELGWRINKAGYAIINNPAIKSIHMGNPKNLENFYRKEKWHALGMLGTFKICCLDKPVIMTILFFACNISALMLFPVLIYRSSVNLAILTLTVISLIIPAVTAVYRVISFKNSKYFVQLILLYWIYYIARANVLLSL